MTAAQAAMQAASAPARSRPYTAYESKKAMPVCAAAYSHARLPTARRAAASAETQGVQASRNAKKAPAEGALMAEESCCP